MKVITINEQNHGFIGIAKDYYSAISFLINDHWLTEDYTVWNANKKHWMQLYELLGENWVDKIFSWDIQNFNEFFGFDYIYLKEEDVVEYVREG